MQNMMRKLYVAWASMVVVAAAALGISIALSTTSEPVVCQTDPSTQECTDSTYNLHCQLTTNLPPGQLNMGICDNDTSTNRYGEPKSSCKCKKIRGFE